MDVIVVSRAPGVAGFSARVVAPKLERESQKQVDAWKRLLSMKNSQHLRTPPIVSPRNDLRGTSSEILY